MFAGFWRSIILFGRVLMACRISLLSAGGGLLLLWLVLQAQNLLADLSHPGLLFWFAFFLAVFFIWAFPVHYGARKILEEDDWLVSASLRRTLPAHELRRLEEKLRRDTAGPIEWLPRVLGLVPFVAVAIGLHYSDRSMNGALALSVAKRAHDQIFWLGVADFIAGALFLAFVILRRPALKRAIAHFDGPRELRAHRGRMEAGLDIFARLSLIGTALIFVVAYFFPHWLAAAIPRAMLIPFLFGSLVLALSLLARLGYRYGFPIVAPLVAFCVVVTAFDTHFNDLRVLPTTPDRLEQRQIEVADAVARWRVANGCTGGDCPSALIVAAEGGASRAAFMEATLLGEIMDHLSAPGLAPGRKIFAISGVSGGAFGGAVVRAALADAAESGNAPPCHRAPRVWFGADQAADPDFHWTWRSCLQALVSGDYLSSGFIGLGFRDNLAPREWFTGPASWIEDRAALLEQSWEAYFDYVAGGAAPGTGWTCPAEGKKGLCRRLGYAKDVAAGGWLPLLMLNGTSVETGRRIIATDLVSSMKIPGEKPGTFARLALYPEAYDLFEMLSASCAKEGEPCPHSPQYPDDDPLRRNGPDLRLSTAALISARFPIISPAGALRTKGDENRGDRVVDGGYFENAGLTTALDLAEALRREGVTPAILWVQNDPIGARVDTAPPPRQAQSPQIGPLDESFATGAFGVLSSPVDALIATREGHGAEAANIAVRALARMNGLARHGWFTMGVQDRPDIGPADNDPTFDRDCGALVKELDGNPLSMTEVSMSWWLSAAVQADLDAQVCARKNRAGLIDLMRLLSKGK